MEIAESVLGVYHIPSMYESWKSEPHIMVKLLYLKVIRKPIFCSLLSALFPQVLSFLHRNLEMEILAIFNMFIYF